MRKLFSLSGWRAQRHAVAQIAVAEEPIISEDEKKSGVQLEYVCAHYTILGLSFAIKLKNGRLIQKRVPTPVRADGRAS